MTKASAHPRRRALTAITGARFVAAIGVVLFHVVFVFGESRTQSPVVNALAGMGSLGVNFFFLLSGFVLAYNYLGADGMATTKGSFYLARFARIYPVYAFALALGIAYRVFVESPCTTAVCSEGDTPAVGLASVFLLQAWLPYVADAFNGPGWTLSVEAFFYACFPLLLAGIARLRSRVSLVTVVALALAATQVGTLLVATLDPGAHGRTWIQFDPLLRLPEFTLGIAAWCWVRRFGFPRSVRDWHLDAVLVSGIPVLYVLGKVAGRAGIDPIAVNLGLFDTWFLVLILALAMGRGAVAGLLGTSVAQVLGESSYALYILHWPAWFWFATLVDDRRQTTPLVLAVYTVGVVLLSVAVWATIERPARRRILGRRRSDRVAEWAADSSSR